MLHCGIILIVLASIIGGWVFMCDALPIPPRLAWSPIPLLIAIFVALVGGGDTFLRQVVFWADRHRCKYCWLQFVYGHLEHDL